MNFSILASRVCDLNTSFNWGQLGDCYLNNPLIGGEISLFLILIFFVLITLFANLKMSVWYIIAAVLAWFLLVSFPGNDIVYMIFIIVSFVIPALMLIPAFKRFVDK
jgi:hypothetical protein